MKFPAALVDALPQLAEVRDVASTAWRRTQATYVEDRKSRNRTRARCLQRTIERAVDMVRCSTDCTTSGVVRPRRTTFIAAMIDRLVHDVELIALKGDPSRAQARDLGRGAPPTDVPPAAVTDPITPKPPGPGWPTATI